MPQSAPEGGPPGLFFFGGVTWRESVSRVMDHAGSEHDVTPLHVSLTNNLTTTAWRRIPMSNGVRMRVDPRTGTKS